MARNAKPHLEFCVLEPVHGLHLAMTLFAKDFLFDVPFVVEKDMLRQIIHLDPGGRCLGVEIMVLFLDLRVIGNDVFVAVEAFFHSRDPWERGAAHIRVTELALDFLHSRVDPVAEGDRLLRAKALDRHEIKKIEPEKDDSQAAEDHHEGQLISEQRLQGNPYFTSCF
jgi:hypothetical protein